MQHAVTSTESAKQYTDSEVWEDLARSEASWTPALCTKEGVITHVRASMREELHRRTRGRPPLPPHFVLLEHKKEGLRHGLILQPLGVRRATSVVMLFIDRDTKATQMLWRARVRPAVPERVGWRC